MKNTIIFIVIAFGFWVSAYTHDMDLVKQLEKGSVTPWSTSKTYIVEAK